MQLLQMCCKYITFKLVGSKMIEKRDIMSEFYAAFMALKIL
jgi:hypothetical protein